MQQLVSVTIVTLLVTMVAAPLIGVLLSWFVKDRDKDGNLIPLGQRRVKIFLWGGGAAAAIFFLSPVAFPGAPDWVEVTFGVAIGNLFFLFAATTVLAAILWEGSDKNFGQMLKGVLPLALVAANVMLVTTSKHFSDFDRLNASWVQLGVGGYKAAKAAGEADSGVARWVGAVSPVYVIVTDSADLALRQANGELTESSQQSSHVWLSLLALVFVIGGTYFLVIKKKRPQPQVTPPQAKPEAAATEGWDQVPPAPSPPPKEGLPKGGKKKVRLFSFAQKKKKKSQNG